MKCTIGQWAWGVIWAMFMRHLSRQGRHERERRGSVTPSHVMSFTWFLSGQRQSESSVQDKLRQGIKKATEDGRDGRTGFAGVRAWLHLVSVGVVMIWDDCVWAREG